eukprot:CAMPEP_0167764080 /NCGR_PEP_ID=MMETSP0110_2-20121227/13797_1 /TAXON_ID=629695 /ORGANISM="Gymnochlora sp., Strain CCMP2014" /LENGTH=573 /DNA_ID=CAMNT_0007651371 /DNA_START=28 /DNA_END=1749 /DNA_ORIENTATION=+
MSDAAVGMMSDAYFVGKRALLEWLNGFLDTNIRKVEELSTGWAHCQIVDALFPGKVKLSKVNFAAKHEYEYVKNFKVVQDIFTRNKISKPVPVQKLVKGKYQDNFEFLQWMKSFFDSRWNGEPYDGPGRRAGKKGARKVRKPAEIKRNPSSRGSSRVDSKNDLKSSRPSMRINVRTSNSALPAVVNSPKNTPAKPAKSSSAIAGTSRHRAKQLEMDVQDLTQQLDDSNAAFDDLKDKTDEEIADLQKNLEEVTAEREAALEEAADLKNKIATMVPQKDLEDSRAELEMMSEENKAQKEEISSLREDKRANENDLERQLGRERQQLEQMLIEAKKLRLENAALKSELKQLRKKEIDYQMKVKTSSDKLTSLEKASKETESTLKADLDKTTTNLSKVTIANSILNESIGFLKPMSWWSIRNELPATAFGQKVLKIALTSLDEKSNGEDKHVLASVVDQQGRVIGRACRTPSDAIRAPFYVTLGDRTSTDPPLYLIFQVRLTKIKKKGTKIKELAWSVLELSSLMDFHKSMDNPLPLDLLKKPSDFTREADSMKPLGKSKMKVAFELMHLVEEKKE